MPNHFYGKTTIKSFEAKELKKRSLGVRIADELTAVFGSVPFFVLNLIFFGAWVAINTDQVPGIALFDPYPFVLLITFVSLEAIVLSIVVLMSQNRAGFISSLKNCIFRLTSSQKEKLQRLFGSSKK